LEHDYYDNEVEGVGVDLRLNKRTQHHTRDADWEKVYLIYWVIVVVIVIVIVIIVILGLVFNIQM
jgi:t-SNARE complex subunit (syntaxin)